ncbi:hypothetical protein BHE74_00039213 [Ensete ventricosum]|nr:hypothetical protein BHE74_00039213 [Ensete ventricosum]
MCTVFEHLAYFSLHAGVRGCGRKFCGAQVEEELDITPHIQAATSALSEGTLETQPIEIEEEAPKEEDVIETQKKAEGEVEEAKVAAATTDGVRENVETPAEQETKEAAVEAEPEVEIEAVAEERVEEVVAPAEPPSEATVADEEKKEEVKQVEEEAAAA